MKKELIIISVLLLTVLPMAASQQFETTVVDIQTSEPLPFASVYINKVSSTITNAEGTFSIKCDSTDVLRISYVGYKPLTIQANQIGSHIGLQPMENLLNEVTVIPIDLKNLIRKTTRETRRQLQKYEKRKSNFFYRQISFADSTCFELMEAFLQARPAVYLRNLSLLKGRFAGIQPDSLHQYSFWTNFFTVSELPMLTRSDYQYNTDAKPLTRNYKDFYDLDYDLLGDSTDRLVAVHFIPKETVKTPILAVTLYIDENTYRLRKMEGEIRNVVVYHRDFWIDKDDPKKEIKKVLSFKTASFNLTVNMTEERGFLEVQSVYIDEHYDRFDKPMVTRSILFNVGDYGSDMGSPIASDEDLHDYIREQGYDPQFWHDNEIILRTPIEQKVMELFEHQNLFGVF